MAQVVDVIDGPEQTPAPTVAARDIRLQRRVRAALSNVSADAAVRFTVSH